MKMVNYGRTVPCVIFDVDGTLSNPSHRVHYVTGRTGKNWTKFFEGMGEDPTNAAVVDLYYAMRDRGHKIFIFTGRPEEYRQQTMKWLQDNVDTAIKDSDVYMRPAWGDTRADHIVKKEMLEKIRADGWEPTSSVDDRKSITDLWRSENITCFQCAEGDFDPTTYYEPAPGTHLLTLLVGPSGAGKSTYAVENYPGRHIISSDHIREDMTGDFRDQSMNAQVFKALHDVAEMRMKHGLPVVVDATNLHRKDRLAIVALAPKGTVVEYVVIDRPLEEKLATAGWRADVKIGDLSLVEKHHLSFQSAQKDILKGDGFAHIRVIDKRINPTYKKVKK